MSHLRMVSAVFSDPLWSWCGYRGLDWGFWTLDSRFLHQKQKEWTLYRPSFWYQGWQSRIQVNIQSQKDVPGHTNSHAPRAGASSTQKKNHDKRTNRPTDWSTQRKDACRGTTSRPSVRCGDCVTDKLAGIRTRKLKVNDQLSWNGYLPEAKASTTTKITHKIARMRSKTTIFFFNLIDCDIPVGPGVEIFSGFTALKNLLG